MKIIIVLTIFIVICSIIRFYIAKVENEIEFIFYAAEEPYSNGQYYEIAKEHSGIIDYDELRIACNEKCLYDLEEIDFLKEAYLVSSGKKIKRIYYHYFDKVEMLNKVRGYVLCIEYQDMPLNNEEYIYIIDNSKGPFCTEDEKYYFGD